MKNNTTIKINNVDYVLKSELDALKKTKIKVINSKPLPFEIGGKYFIRTVTYFATGEVVAIHGDFLELGEAAWIADTGRFSDAMSTGILNEVEPVKVPMYLNTNTITDAFRWDFKLPNEQK